LSPRGKEELVDRFRGRLVEKGEWRYSVVRLTVIELVSLIRAAEVEGECNA
jgi:hypothetical protein